jgi:hypothetical protein
MSFTAETVVLPLAAVLVGLIIGIFAYAGNAKRKASRIGRDATVIRNAIIDYFRRSGVAVTADCTTLDRGQYIVVIESEPMKRFRLSHIIEMTLREHVRRTCGLELDKIYWRFPIKEATQAAAASPDAGGQTSGNGAEEKKAEETSDEYINEGLENYRHIPKPEVTELSWESFEQITTPSRETKDRQGKE